MNQLKRDELLAAVELFGLEVEDRRVRDQLVSALGSSRKAALPEILEPLSRDRLKELCRALELDDSGRTKAELLKRLGGASAAEPEPASKLAETSKVNGQAHARGAAKPQSNGKADLLAHAITTTVMLTTLPWKIWRALAMGVIFAAIVTATGCGPKHVIFAAPQQGSQPVVRAYVDYLGDLYEPSATPSSNRPCAKSVFTVDSFKVSDGICGAVLECTKERRAFESKWRERQLELWAKLAEQIEMVRDKDQPLLVLIHGFNVPSAFGDYADAASRVLEVAKATNAPPPLVLEIHWDGRYGGTTRHQWSQAQFTAPLVGLALRELFLHLPAELPVRVLTHSLGGLVAATLVGNPSRALPQAMEVRARRGAMSCNFEDYFDREAFDYAFFSAHVNGSCPHYSLPKQQDLRIGMLAPAVSVDSFAPHQTPDASQVCACANAGGDCKDSCGVLHESAELIIGINSSDSAIVKLGLGSNKVGATSMGSGGRGCWAAKRAKFRLGARSSFYDFTIGANDCADSDHAFSCYLARRRFLPFAKRLLGSNPASISDDYAVLNQCEHPKKRQRQRYGVR